MKTAIVIPAGMDRSENLEMCKRSILDMHIRPDAVVVVQDGGSSEVEVADVSADPGTGVVWHSLRMPKHVPGFDHPRNVGVRYIERMNTHVSPQLGFTHVWFLDSDILVACEAYDCYLEANAPGIMVGPYEWLPSGVREPVHEMKNDPRWPSFDTHESHELRINDLSAGLACFGGNLIWPIADFIKIGGFWNELYHGRCEDGELGLRAVACGIPITFVRGARGWHLDHPVDFEAKLERNKRDVPMLNERHPWVEGEGMFVVEEDGKRFDVKCPCGWSGNTMEIWEHQASCEQMP